jgi:transcriptional regulator with XRE-family HTH domain
MEIFHMTTVRRSSGAPPPSKEDVIAARRASGLTQEEAAKLVHLKSYTRWSEYERGDRNIDAARFELFKIKTGQHPEYLPRSKVLTV